MKKLLLLVLPCVLILSNYLSHQLSTDGNPFPLHPTIEDLAPGRKLAMELSIPASKPASKQKAEIDHRMQASDIKIGLTGGEHNDDAGELIYSADYPRVMTHPSPQPKHPKP